MEAKSKSKVKGSGGGRRSTLERKEIERKRRQHMKGLCLELASLIPKEHYSSKDTMTQMGSLDEAAAYIKKLKERVDELQHRRSSAQLMAGMRGAAGGVSTSMTTTTTSGSELEGKEAAPAPVVEVRHHDGSSLDVVLICSVERPFKFHEVITVLEEEGAEILNANFSVAGHKVFYIVHSRAFSSRIGIEVSRVSERLRGLV